MDRYTNGSGDSSVAFYEIGADFVRVQFSDGAIYLYNYASAGAENIERMKTLARGGRGLGSFIIKNVKKKYARKER